MMVVMKAKKRNKISKQRLREILLYLEEQDGKDTSARMIAKKLKYDRTTAQVYMLLGWQEGFFRRHPITYNQRKMYLYKASDKGKSFLKEDQT